MGYRCRKPGIYTRDLSDEAVGWVGLNTAYRKEELDIAPVVGIRHKELEHTVALLLRQEPHEFVPPSISVNLGYLMPERTFRSWSVGEGAIDGPIEELCIALQDYAHTFMHENSTLSTLFSTMRDSPLGLAHQLEYRLPTAAFLLGAMSDADKMIEESLRQMIHRTDPAAKSFRDFAERLRQSISEAH